MYVDYRVVQAITASRLHNAQQRRRALETLRQKPKTPKHVRRWVRPEPRTRNRFVVATD